MARSPANCLTVELIRVRKSVLFCTVLLLYFYNVEL